VQGDELGSRMIVIPRACAFLGGPRDLPSNRSMSAFPNLRSRSKIKTLMNDARIAELLEPFFDPANDQRLTTDHVRHISTYIDILIRWNARINLTAVRDPEQIVTRHFGESLFAARHLFPRKTHGGTAALGCPAERSSAAPATTVADIGSGAGFPGIPIKLWTPEISLTLIESNHKKATFLREIARALTLTNIDILTARAESLTAKFDVVILRAVERFESILPVAAGLVTPGGRLALLISEPQLSQAQAQLPSFSWANPLRIPNSHARALLVGVRE
jgi:16S rRNA (guanine527-N7)-methyltransferase